MLSPDDRRRSVVVILIVLAMTFALVSLAIGPY